MPHPTLMPARPRQKYRVDKPGFFSQFVVRSNTDRAMKPGLLSWLGTIVATLRGKSLADLGIGVILTLEDEGDRLFPIACLGILFLGKLNSVG